MDIGAWLRDLGLDQYEIALVENDIDAAVLPNLTADDLRELGITSIGHRRRLLDAITALSTATVGQTPTGPAPNLISAKAERRF